MALSQQYVGLMLVPWFNREEWDHVYDLLYEHKDLRGAQSLLKIWKQRTPKLPSAVECTLIIVDAYLFKDSSSEDRTRLLYSASIMRFLNLCCSQEDKQGTFTQKAKSHNFPEWIVNMRHDIAHSCSVPSLELLICALDFCHDWIRDNYWERQKTMLESYSPLKSVSKDEVASALKTYCRIVSLRYLKSCVKTAREIECYESKLKLLISDYRWDNMDSIRTVLSRLLRRLTDEVGEVRQSWLKELIVETIILDGGLLCVYTRDRAYFDVESADRLPKDVLNIWDDLLDFVLDVGCLQLLLERLLRVVNNEIAQAGMRRICGLWIAYLLERLLLTKLIKQAHVKDNIKKSVFQKYPNMRTLSPFVYHSEIEAIFSTVRYLKEIAEDNPNVYTLLFIESLLELCEASAKEAEFVEVIRILVNSKTHTAESVGDFDELSDDVCLDSLRSVPAGTSKRTEKAEPVPKCRFIPVKDFSIFENCAMGILKHQNANINPCLVNEYNL
uniref:Uncharacterized protein n=1 Tax=Photinus pyralis TaxID=7054 RepID=A0A1Y1MZE2_PHOPY